MLLVCIALGDEDEIGGELVGVPDDGIKRSGGGSKCGAPGITDEGKKFPWKLPGMPPVGIPLDKPGSKGELDSEDDDFLASSCRLPKFNRFVFIVLLVEFSLSFSFGVPKTDNCLDFV